jgi:hypothetical protein
MQRLEVSGAVRPLKWPLGVKWLSVEIDIVAWKLLRVTLAIVCGLINFRLIFIRNYIFPILIQFDTAIISFEGDSGKAALPFSLIYIDLTQAVLPVIEFLRRRRS